MLRFFEGGGGTGDGGGGRGVGKRQNLQSPGFRLILLEEFSSLLNEPVCFHDFLGIYAYATLKDDATISAEDLRKDLKDIVRQKIGSFAVPEVIQVILFGN